MKNLMIVLLIFCSAILSAQCEFKVNEIDKFEKVRKIETERVKVMNPYIKLPVIFFSLGLIDTSYFIKVDYTLRPLLLVDENNYLSILFEDDTVWKIDNIKRHSMRLVDARIAGYGFIHEYEVYYEINKSDLLKYSTKTISMIRINTGEGVVDVDLNVKNVNKEKGKKYFINHARCILSQ